MEPTMQRLRYNNGMVEQRHAQIQRNCLYVYNAGSQNTWVLDKVYDLFDAHTRTYKNQGVFVTILEGCWNV